MKNSTKILSVIFVLLSLTFIESSYAQLRATFNAVTNSNVVKKIDKVTPHKANKVLNQTDGLKKMQAIKNKTANLPSLDKRNLNSQSSFQQKSFKKSDQISQINNTKSTRSPNNQIQKQFDRAQRERQLAIQRKANKRLANQKALEKKRIQDKQKQKKKTKKNTPRKNITKVYSTRKEAKDARPKPKPLKKGNKGITRQTRNKKGEGNKMKTDKGSQTKHFHDINHNNKNKANIHYRVGSKKVKK